jgi:hypothetical protein
MAEEELMAKLNLSTVKFKGLRDVTIYHTVPMKGINNFIDCVDNWSVRTKEYTAESLRDYINSKTHMTGHFAMTVKQFKKFTTKK